MFPALVSLRAAAPPDTAGPTAAQGRRCPPGLGKPTPLPRSRPRPRGRGGAFRGVTSWGRGGGRGRGEPGRGGGAARGWRLLGRWNGAEGAARRATCPAAPAAGSLRQLGPPLVSGRGAARPGEGAGGRGAEAAEHLPGPGCGCCPFFGREVGRFPPAFCLSVYLVCFWFFVVGVGFVRGFLGEAHQGTREGSYCLSLHLGWRRLRVGAGRGFPSASRPVSSFGRAGSLTVASRKQRPRLPWPLSL